MPPNPQNPQPAIWFPTIRAKSGSDVFTERLVAGLLRRGIRAEIHWYPHRAEYAPWSVRKPKPPSWANICHINSWLPYRLVPPELPTVVTIHSNVHDPALHEYKGPAQRLYHQLWIKPTERRNLTNCAAATAVSHYTAEISRRTFGVESIQAIHNGVDLKVFTPHGRERPHEPFRLLFAGNWIKRKGADLLGPIMRELGTDFVLYYTEDRSGKRPVGDLPEHCLSAGRPDSPKKMAELYRSVDALLFPTRLEGFGLVAAEAMACGLPVIASNNSALPEVVDPAATGLLCRTGDIKAFVGAIRALRDQPGLWRRLSEGGPIRTQQAFSETRQLDRYHDLYQKLLSVEPNG